MISFGRQGDRKGICNIGTDLFSRSGTVGWTWIVRCRRAPKSMADNQDLIDKIAPGEIEGINRAIHAYAGVASRAVYV